MGKRNIRVSGRGRFPRFATNRLYKCFAPMLDSTVRHGSRAIKRARLEAWENPYPDRDYEVNISFPEFTCLCPRSGYPDFATIRVSYVPDKKIIELKSLKLYLNSFRDRQVSHEEATNEIHDALRKKLRPRRMEVIGDFNPRGNVKTVVRVGV
jgi:7-cyano-7-deazaguanine reductase